MLYKNLSINGKTFPLAVSQSGKGAPTTGTKGGLGVLYMNVDSGEIYKCISAQAGKYVWERVPNDADIRELSFKGTEQDAAIRELSSKKADKENEWKMIETFTVPDGITAFTRDKEPDGTPYNLKKIILLVEKADTSTAGGATHYTCENRKGEKIVDIYFPNDAENKYIKIHLDRHNGYYTMSKDNGSNKFAFSNRQDGYGYQRQFSFNAEARGPVTKISGIVVEPESIVQIWAVK